MSMAHIQYSESEFLTHDSQVIAVHQVEVNEIETDHQSCSTNHVADQACQTDHTNHCASNCIFFLRSMLAQLPYIGPINFGRQFAETRAGLFTTGDPSPPKHS